MKIDRLKIIMPPKRLGGGDRETKRNKNWEEAKKSKD